MSSMRLQEKNQVILSRITALIQKKQAAKTPVPTHDEKDM